jgi:hypothetical protein
MVQYNAVTLCLSLYSFKLRVSVTITFFLSFSYLLLFTSDFCAPLFLLSCDFFGQENPQPFIQIIMQNRILQRQRCDEKILKFITLCSQFHCALIEEEPLVHAQNTTRVTA